MGGKLGTIFARTGHEVVFSYARSRVHSVENQGDIDKILAPAGAMEAFEAAKKAGKRGANHGDEPYRHSGATRRQGRRLDGTRQRRTVQRLT
jgi:hypothetical protein